MLALVVAGCTTVSHLKALQPAAVPSSPPIAPPAVVPAVGNGTMQRGIDIDAYTYPGRTLPQQPLPTWPT